MGVRETTCGNMLAHTCTHTCTHTHTHTHKHCVVKQQLTLSSGTPRDTQVPFTSHFHFLAAEKLVGGAQPSLVFIYCLSLGRFSPALVRLGRAPPITTRRQQHRPCAPPPAAPPLPVLLGVGRGSRDLLKRCDFIISMAFCGTRKEEASRRRFVAVCLVLTIVLLMSALLGLPRKTQLLWMAGLG